MIITNLTKGVLGLDGIIQLNPNSDTELPELPDYVERALRLHRAGLVKVVFDKLPPAQEAEAVPSTVENVLAVAPEEVVTENDADTSDAPEQTTGPTSRRKKSNAGGNP